MIGRTWIWLPISRRQKKKKLAGVRGDVERDGDMPFGSRSFLRCGSSLVSSDGANFEDVMFTDRGGLEGSAALENLEEAGTFVNRGTVGDETAAFVM